VTRAQVFARTKAAEQDGPKTGLVMIPKRNVEQHLLFKNQTHRPSGKAQSLREGFMKWLEKFSQKSTEWTGTSWALLLSVVIILVWAAAGPFVKPPFNDTWQLVINTLTTLVTFVMVFLIQRSQNKDSLVLQTKLNELLAATKASNRLIDLEQLPEAEVRRLHARYEELAKRAAAATNPTKQCSVEETEEQLENGKREKPTTAAN
jgi:low affinity Fe/Cu permease